MANQNRWSKDGDAKLELEHKLSECMWWLIILAERMDVDIAESFDNFLSSIEERF